MSFNISEYYAKHDYADLVFSEKTSCNACNTEVPHLGCPEKNKENKKIDYESNSTCDENKTEIIQTNSVENKKVGHLNIKNIPTSGNGTCLQIQSTTM